MDTAKKNWICTINRYIICIFTIVIVLVSNGLLNTLRSAKINITEKQNIYKII